MVFFTVDGLCCKVQRGCSTKPDSCYTVNPLENFFFQKPDGLCQLYASNTGIHLAHREETFSRRQKLFY